MTGKDGAEEITRKLLGREKCRDCGKAFPIKDMVPHVWPLFKDYTCKECDKQYECTID